MWNELSDDNIQLGDKLIVAKKLIVDNSQTIAEGASKKEKLAKAEREERHYYVKKGDSLFSIAKKYPGVSISDIKKWNGINGNSLKPGMKLKING
jgi:membrane-bound lytic murein transglycosylase D